MYLSNTPYRSDVVLILEPRVRFPLTLFENHVRQSGNRVHVSRSAVFNRCDWSYVCLFHISICACGLNAL